MFKCMSIYKRSDDVLEVQEGRLQHKLSQTDDVCSAFNMDEERMPFTTLLSEYNKDQLPDPTYHKLSASIDVSVLDKSHAGRWY